MLGSDARTGESIDESQQGPSRADTIMLVRAEFGGVRKLSIPRDSFAEIPGHGGQKINAAYALGGPALMIRTVERFMGNGMQVNHLIEVDFEDFPKLIDALGGIDVEVEHRICSPPFDNFWKGLRFKKGEHHLDGERALGFARIRKNACAPNETDIERAQRQQQVLTAIKDSVVSPGTFFRLPLVSWRAPRALKTDMKGPQLLALFADLATGSSDDTMVLEPSCLSCGPSGSLVVSAGAKTEAADSGSRAATERRGRDNLQPDCGTLPELALRIPHLRREIAPPRPHRPAVPARPDRRPRPPPTPRSRRPPPA